MRETLTVATLPPGPEQRLTDALAGYAPLSLLLLFRAICAAELDIDAIDLRDMSLRETMVKATEAHTIRSIKLLRAVGGIGLREAKDLYDAAQEVAKADHVLSLVPDPTVQAREVNH